MRNTLLWLASLTMFPIGVGALLWAGAQLHGRNLLRIWGTVEEIPWSWAQKLAQRYLDESAIKLWSVFGAGGVLLVGSALLSTLRT